MGREPYNYCEGEMSDNPIREGGLLSGSIERELPAGTKIARFGKFFIACHPDHPALILDPVLGKWQEIQPDESGEPVMVELPRRPHSCG